MTLRVAIVDDEAHARTAIRILLAQRPDVEIVAECRHGLEALEVLRWVSVDLLLLDVQMPGLDGFGVIHALTPHRVPPTVFLTAFDGYALRAFEVDAVDYVLKPFDDVRFLAAFDAPAGASTSGGARSGRSDSSPPRPTAAARLPRHSCPLSPFRSATASSSWTSTTSTGSRRRTST